MKKIAVAASLAGLLLVGLAFAFINGEAAASTKVVVYKTSTCTCCSGWVEHMKEAGFDVEVNDMTQANLTSVKTQHGIDREHWSCHTAEVNGYLIEGHVPASQIVRMLAEQPEIAGLAVPGMITGSPGMEAADKSLHQAYDVVSFTKEGASEVYHHVEADR